MNAKSRHGRTSKVNEMTSTRVETGFRRRWENHTAFQRIRGGIKRLLGLNTGGRNFPVFPDDTFLVSYPRSGNTWTRFLIANLLFAESNVSFLNVDYLIPDPFNINRRALAKIPRPRFIKSHEYFDPRYKRVIYIVRDPRDVVLSSYHFHRKQRQIPDEYSINQYVTRFLAGEVWGMYASWDQNVSSWLATPRAHRIGGLFGSWRDSVSSWLNAPIDGSNFLVLRYETMVAEPARELKKIAAFLGVQATPELLAQVGTRSSASELRKLEQSQAKNWVMTKNTRQDVPFVGSARAGGWKFNLPADSVAEIEKSLGPLMTVLGYDLTCAKQPLADPEKPSSFST